MSNKVCCVLGCSNSAGSKDVLHKFPNPSKDKDRFNSWVYFAGGEILGLSNDHIFKYRRICHKHFEEKYWCRNNLLSNIAVPTKNMPGLTLPTLATKESFRPLRSIQNVMEASSSKDPVAPGHKVSKTVVDAELKENVDPVAPGQKVSKTVVDAEMKENVESVAEPNYATIPVIQNLEIVQDIGNDHIPETSKTETTKVVHKRKQCTRISQVEQLLRSKLLRVGVKLSKCRSKVKRQAVKIRAMQNIVSHPELLKALDNWPTTAKTLTLLQFREHKKGLKGRRFTLKEKLMALSIFKQSPKGYRFFRKIFILPSPQTLVKLINMANIKPGINEKVVQQIKKAAEKIKNIEDRLCIVLFDEMSLKCNLSYSERKDCVTGFVTNGKETRPEFADHAQVFMIRGLIRNYKQPVAYTFSQAATKGPELAAQLKVVIAKLQEAGLIMVATVCDQGTNNTQCIKLLMQETNATLLRKGEEQRGNYFVVNEHEIIPLYDPPHLIKCIRNNLISKDLEYIKDDIKKTAKWSHIVGLHNENPGYKGIRLVPKLTDYHCIPAKIPKMKVKYATQVFSQTVATNMGYLADKGILSSESKETADILLFFDQLFDSVNGSFGKRKKFGKPLLRPATPTSTHHEVWQGSKQMLNKMKFVNSQSLKVEHVPTIKNWVWTIEGIELLLKKIHIKYGVNSVWMRHLNQDPIENFFGSIRSHGCRNVNPSPEKFESAYTTLLVNSLSSAHTPGANCESDNCYALSNVIITDSDDCKDILCELNNIPEITITPLEEKNDPRKMGALQYVSGYFVKNAKKNIFKGCRQCKKDMLSADELEYIKYREYCNKKWLCSPSHALISCISSLQDINYHILKYNLEKQHIFELIKTIILMHVEFDFIKCKKHKEILINYIIKLSCRLFIFNYCKDINKILSNRRECDDDSDPFKLKAKKYCHKCFKRKNK